MEAKDFKMGTWKCSHALARLLFEQGEVSVLGRQIRTSMKDGELEKLQPGFSENEASWKELLHLRKVLPDLDMSLRQPPVVWVRFGFWVQQRGVKLGNRFLERYAEWREQCSNIHGGTTVTWAANECGAITKTSSCPLDYFLHAPDIGVDFGSQIAVSLKHDIEPNDESSNRRIRTTPDHVGKHAFRELETCIHKAAERGLIKGLTANTDGGRYICHMTREELAHALHAKFPVARQIKISTIIRGIGEFTACSRPRREKL